jgi:hypothetical protein
VILYLFGFLMTLLLTAIAVGEFSYGEPTDRLHWWYPPMGLLFGAGALFSVGQIASTLTWRVTLTACEIRTNSIFGEKRLARSEIEGFLYSERHGSLEIKAGGESMLLNGKALRLPQVRAWLAGLKNLDPQVEIDAREAIRQWETLEREEALGEAPRGRLGTILRLRRRIGVPIAVYGLLCLGVIFVPTGWWPVVASVEVIALLTPALTMPLRHYASVMPPPGSPLINLGPLWSMAPIWVFLRGPMLVLRRALETNEWENQLDLVALALGPALILWGLTLWSTPNARSPLNAFGAALVAVAWGAGVAWLIQYTPMLDVVGL